MERRITKKELLLLLERMVIYRGGMGTRIDAFDIVTAIDEEKYGKLDLSTHFKGE